MKYVLKLAKYLGYSIYAVCAAIMITFLIPATGWKALTVVTGSMKPAIAPGTLVFIHRAAPADLHAGDIATYINPADQSQTITHRIQSVQPNVTPRTFIFKGDANPKADPNPVVAGRVVGKVVWQIPALGRYMAWLRKPLVLAVIIILPGLLVIGSELGKLRRLFSGQPPTRTPPTPTPPTSSGPPPNPTAPVTPSVKAPPKTRRPIDGMRRFLIIPLIGLCLFLGASPTYSQLQSQTSLSGNSISTAQIAH